jgi:hypothetical protein
MDFRKFVNDIEQVLYKDSMVYNSNKWKPLSECITSFPVHRKLTVYECILDLDNVAPTHFETIPQYLNETGLKFIAYKSSNSGMHIHFWCDVFGKNEKRMLVEHIASKLEMIFGVKNDILPMGHGFIRAEYSFHPVKNTQKVPIYYNISELEYVNHIDNDLRSRININTCSEQVVSTTGGDLTTCMKYILSHSFVDGRDRLLFAIISWYKSDGKSAHDTVEIAWNWCKKQPNFVISKSALYAKYNSTSGTVGCKWRHAILNELGVDMSRCTR